MAEWKKPNKLFKIEVCVIRQKEKSENAESHINQKLNSNRQTYLLATFGKSF